MGTALVVIGMLFLLSGLAISIYEAFQDIMGKANVRLAFDSLRERQQAISASEITEAVVEALKELLQVFARLAVGIQLSLIGLVLVYWGLTM